MNKLDALKQGDTFYEVDGVTFKITKYVFHGKCIVPKSGEYYITYGSNSELVRMYKTSLLRIVEKNIRTYIDALKRVIELKRQSIEDDLQWLAKLEGKDV